MAGPAARAGLAYFALVFAAGFALGAVRVAVLLPAVGELAAVLIEMPAILAIAWFACAALVRQFDVAPTVPARLVMGGVAFLCLIAAEVTLSAIAFGRGPAAFVAGLARPAGAVGLTGQIIFGLFPWLQARRA